MSGTVYVLSITDNCGNVTEFLHDNDWILQDAIQRAERSLFVVKHAVTKRKLTVDDIGKHYGGF